MGWGAARALHSKRAWATTYAEQTFETDAEHTDCDTHGSCSDAKDAKILRSNRDTGSLATSAYFGWGTVRGRGGPITAAADVPGGPSTACVTSVKPT